MTSSTTPPVNLDRLMEQIRAELEQCRKKTAEAVPMDAEGASPGTVEDPVFAELEALRGGAGAELLSMERARYHIDDFLRFHDREFVRNAYRGILHREPDPDGERHYLKMLRGGIFSKEEILGQLRYSREGRVQRVRVEGLVIAYGLQFLYRIPAFGYLVQWAVGLCHLPRVLGNLRRLDSALHARVYQLGQTLDQIVQFVQTAHQNQQQQIQYLHGRLETRVGLDDPLETRVGLDAPLGTKANLHLIEFLETVKADRVELLGKADLAELNSKAERSWVEEELAQKAGRNWVEEELAQKAGRNWVEEELAQKAGRDWVEEVVNRKADVPEVEKLAAETAQQQQRIVRELAEAGERERHRGQQIQQLRRALVEQERRLRILLREVRAREEALPGVDEPATGAAVMGEYPCDAFYVGFEDQFRGTREDIKERAKVYLQPIQEVGAGTERCPVVDIGCGRGELLELFRDHGLKAYGVDCNEMMVRECREAGLDVVHSDACAYLRQADRAGVGAITALHLVEHLSFDQLLELIDEAFRVLVPNGLLIVETPNPKNLLVGACDFYIDPTHRHPVHPDAIRYVLESRGFELARVFFFEEQDGGRVLLPAEQKSLVTFDDYLRVSRDFAVVAYKNS